MVWKDDDIERGEWNWNARVVKGSPTMGRPVAMETLARTAAEAMASCEAMMELPL